jgi:preprotein translocase subunit YajC
VKVTKTQMAVMIVTLVLAVAAMLYFVFRSWSRRMGDYQRAYTAITVGDSREEVVAAMGEPQAVTDCSATPFADKKLEAEFRSKCFQQYEYVQLMARYTISFDGNGTVINKSKAVSP